jgi:hypothetical protein
VSVHMDWCPTAIEIFSAWAMAPNGMSVAAKSADLRFILGNILFLHLLLCYCCHQYR